MEQYHEKPQKQGGPQQTQTQSEQYKEKIENKIQNLQFQSFQQNRNSENYRNPNQKVLKRKFRNTKKRNQTSEKTFKQSNQKFHLNRSFQPIQEIEQENLPMLVKAQSEISHQQLNSIEQKMKQIQKFQFPKMKANQSLRIRNPRQQQIFGPLPKQSIPITFREYIQTFYIFNDQEDAQTYPSTVALEKLGFVGWKRSRGDGNCYYRAVVYSYLEHLMRYFNKEKISSFIRLINEESQISQQFPKLKKSKKRILKYLKNLQFIYETDRIQGFKSFHEYMQKEKFDKLAIEMIRMLAADYIKRNYQQVFSMFGQELDSLVAKTLKSDQEVEDSILMAVPQSLGIQVVMYMFFQDIVEQIFPYQSEGFKIYIVRNSGHYDILYSEKDHKIEGYNFQDYKYNIILN